MMRATSENLRIQVSLVDNQPRVCVAPELGGKTDLDSSRVLAEPPKRKKRKKSKAVVVPRGSISVKIYPTKNGDYHSHTLVYYEAGCRRREVRASLEEAKDLAEAVLTRLQNGEAMLESFGLEDRACYLRCRQLAAPTGKPLELLVCEYAELLQKLAGANASPADAIKFFLENRPRDFQALPLPKLIEDFLKEKKPEISTKWFNSLECHLERFGDCFAKHCSIGQEPAPLHQLRTADLNTFLRDLNVGGRSRHNYRAAVDQLVRWSKANGHLPKTWSEMEDVKDPGAKSGEIKILTPEQMTALLSARQQMEEVGRARRGFVPMLALMAFAGIRHEELNPVLGEGGGGLKKAPLNWSDVHLEERYIYVPEGVDKTGRGRVVPILDSLVAWLEPYRKPNGHICQMSNSAHGLTGAKRAANIPAGKNQTRNTLRKSFISYRLAVTKSIAQVAEEAGNSPAKIRSNYKRPIPEAEGKRWFNIWPTAADVVQLRFVGL